MKPILTIASLLCISLAKTAGGNTNSNCCYQPFCKSSLNNNCLIEPERSVSKKIDIEADISLLSSWDGKMLLL